MWCSEESRSSKIQYTMSVYSTKWLTKAVPELFIYNSVCFWKYSKSNILKSLQFPVYVLQSFNPVSCFFSINRQKLPLSSIQVLATEVVILSTNNSAALQWLQTCILFVWLDRVVKGAFLMQGHEQIRTQLTETGRHWNIGITTYTISFCSSSAQ